MDLKGLPYCRISLIIFNPNNKSIKQFIKYPLVVVFLLFSYFCKAQKDYEYQDTRRKNESFVRLQPKNVRAEVAAFALAGISESASAASLQKIPYSSFGNDSMNFEGGGVKASVKISRFDKTGHKLDYDEKYLIRIDRKTYYGNFGSLPLTHISEVSLIIDGDTVAIPKIAYFDLYNLNLTYNDKGVQRTTNALYKSKDGRRIYLYLFSKDNAGSYEVTWIFQDKKYLRRVLDYGFM